MKTLALSFATVGMWRCALAGAIFLGGLAPSGAEEKGNWPRWRGPEDNGSTRQGSYPAKLDPENPIWKAPLPGKGCSTPIVWKERIYVTSGADRQNAVLAFDWAGKELWQTRLGPESPGKHRNGSGSNASPTTDGEGIYVYFKSGDLAALEFDGKIRWQTNLVLRFGRDTLFWDHGTSPVVTEKYVVMTRMHQGESWLAAFDKKTGEMRWKADRNYKTPTEGDHGYTTPLVVRYQGKEALMVWGAEHLTLHDSENGKILWSCGNFNPEGAGFWPTVASPVISGEMVLVPFGRADRGQPRLHGIKLGGSGDVTATNRKWQRDDTGPFVPTPAADGGRVYVLRDRGEIECVEPVTGNILWREAFPRASANYYASPVIADGKLYATREDGVIFVARLGEKFELLAENSIGERVIASPVPVSNRLFVRGDKHLFCFGNR